MAGRERFSLRLTPAERMLLEGRALEAGQSVSGWVRDRALEAACEKGGAAVDDRRDNEGEQNGR